jgi:hypothetical protein
MAWKRQLHIVEQPRGGSRGCTTRPHWLVLVDALSLCLSLLPSCGCVEADTATAIFMLEFVSALPLPDDIISKRVFPKTFAWFERYRAAVEKAKSNAAQVKSLDGEAAAKHIHASGFGQPALSVDGGDPARLNEGSEVQVYPADWITEHRDQGRLVGLAPDEVTIAVKSKGDVEIRIHAPRTGFKIKEA